MSIAAPASSSVMQPSSITLSFFNGKMREICDAGYKVHKVSLELVFDASIEKNGFLDYGRFDPAVLKSGHHSFSYKFQLEKKDSNTKADIINMLQEDVNSAFQQILPSIKGKKTDLLISCKATIESKRDQEILISRIDSGKGTLTIPESVIQSIPNIEPRSV